jgi:hypothetical protein
MLLASAAKHNDDPSGRQVYVMYMLLGSAVKFSHNDNPSGRHITCCWEVL